MTRDKRIAKLTEHIMHFTPHWRANLYIEITKIIIYKTLIRPITTAEEQEQEDEEFYGPEPFVKNSSKEEVVTVIKELKKITKHLVKIK
jgi:uncharacterized protein with von Willebrand factor type A (vWA) domain